MAMAFSVALWNVEHFKGGPYRTNRVIGFIKQQNPDVIGLYKVEGAAVYTEVTAQFPGYAFQITEGPDPGIPRWFSFESVSLFDSDG